MMKRLLFVLLTSPLCLATKAQLTDAQKQTEVANYLLNTNRNVSSYFFDNLIVGYQKSLSGSNVKDGKLASTSLSIDEKGASAQVSIKSFDVFYGLYVGANVGGRGTNKFSEIYKDGKYNQTLSGGVVVNLFTTGAVASFLPSDRVQTRSQVSALQTAYNTPPGTDPLSVSTQIAYLTPLLAALRNYEAASVNAVNGVTNAFDGITGQLEDARKGRDTLIALGLLSKNFAEKSAAARQAEVNAVILSPAGLRLKNYISKVEQTLTNAKWTRVRLQWITLKLNYNVTPQPIIDTNKREENYLSSYNDQYLTASFSYNLTWKSHRNSQWQNTLSPTISISTVRPFTDLKKTTVTKQQRYLSITRDTVTQTVFSSEGYETMPSRKLGWSLELPWVLFWGRKNVGLDVAVRGGQNNPDKDNFGGRLGIYIPIEVKDGIPIWIEPVLRVGKLFQKKDPEGPPVNFLKDKVVVGFNLSVSLKEVTTFIKK